LYSPKFFHKIKKKSLLILNFRKAPAHRREVEANDKKRNIDIMEIYRFFPSRTKDKVGEKINFTPETKLKYLGRVFYAEEMYSHFSHKKDDTVSHS
jgi:hypothetical protein